MLRFVRAGSVFMLFLCSACDRFREVDMKHFRTITSTILFIAILSFSSIGFARDQNLPFNRLPSDVTAEGVVASHAQEDAVFNLTLAGTATRADYESAYTEDIVVYPYHFGIDDVMAFFSGFTGAATFSYHRIDDMKSYQGGKFVVTEVSFFAFDGTGDTSVPTLAFQCVYQHRRMPGNFYHRRMPGNFYHRRMPGNFYLVENIIFVEVGTDFAGVTGEPFTIDDELNPIYQHRFVTK